MKIALVVLGSLVALLILVVLVSVFLIRFADGPKGPIPGGAFVEGIYVDSAYINWDEVLGKKPVAEIELQLLNPIGSRTTGAFTHNGELYIPCDLGYVWRRLPNGIARTFLHTVWIFKAWHKQVLVDGRVVARVQGKRYRLNAVRVTDEALMTQFRKHVSIAAGTAFELLDVKTDPKDIWFFRLDARSDITE